MSLDDHQIVKTYIPFVVKEVFKKEALPKDSEEMVQFCQELAKLIIRRIEPVKPN